MEENSGLDLSWFFRQWLTRAGSPVIEGNWRYDAADRKVVIELRQTQTTDPYRLPMGVGLTLEGAPQLKIEKIELTQKQERFEIAADKEPTAVTLDPDTWVLMESRFAKN